MSNSTAGSSKVGELLDAYLGALQSGTAPPREQLLAEHPELAAALDGLEFIQRATLELPAAPPIAGEGLERQLLGDFRLVREVGRGGMAVVYEAEQVSLGRRVALKVLPFAAVLDPKQLQRFKNEALAAAHLHHPHIVPVHAVGVERGVHYYAMQLVEGPSLAAVIREMKGQAPSSEPKTPISSHGSNRDPAYVRMAVALGVQAAEALDHAHELGIVHRDVKPGNLLVDGTGELWITDFGLARSLHDGDLTITGELLGTFRYMSPEQTRAKRDPMDHRTDVYSLGVTLYELLTLEPAFPGDDPQVVMQDIAQKDPMLPRRLNPALPVDLETVLLKAMAKDPSSRYATAQEMADDLGRCLADQPIHARRPSLAARASKWTRRHRGFVAAAFVVLLLVVAALVADKFRVGAEQRRTHAALDQATANLALARSAVDKFLVEIGVSSMLDQPLPKPGRQRLLETALRLYETNFDDPASVDTRVTILHALHRYDGAVALLDRLLRHVPTYGWALMQRGHMLWHLDRDAEALATLDRAVEAEPDNAEAHSFRGCVLSDVGRVQDAFAEHERAIELDGNVAAFHNYRGNDLKALERPEEALAAYDRAIALDGTLANPHSGRGDVLDALGRLEEALASYDRAIALEPTYAAAHSGRGNVLHSLGRDDEALASHDHAIALEPGSAPTQSNRGRLLHALGRLDDAAAAHRKAIELEPRLVQAHVNLGTVLIAQERYDDALHEFDAALQLSPEDAGAHFNIGCVHTFRREWEAAIAEYRRSIASRPRLAVAYGNLGTALAATGKFDEALAEFRAAIAIDADDANVYGGLGNMLRDRGDVKGALDAYNEVVRIRPEYAIGRYCVGGMLARSGRHRDAIAAFRKALELDPKFAAAAMAIGNSFMSLRDPDAAIEAYGQALRIQPDLADACYMRGKACGAKRDFEGEIAAYEEAIRIRPGYAEAYSNMGRACNDRGDFDGAIRACNQALALNSKLPEAHLNLGNAFTDKNDLDQAILHFQAAIDLLTPGLPADPAARSPRQAHDAHTLALAYNSLACAFGDKHESEKEMEAYRAALRTDNEVDAVHYNLAKQLYGASKDAEAEAHYREAIRINPAFAEAYCGLGRLFMAQGRYVDALPLLKQGQEIGSKQKSWTPKPAEWIATIERHLSMEGHLDAIASGAESPKDARERVDFALLLYAKKRYGEAAQFWLRALAEDATLADDLAASHRYNAACTAVLAAANGATDAPTWRERALTWLRADLEARQKAGKASTLDHWKGDPDFATVRENAAALPAAERDAWKALWADVDALLAKAP